MTYEKILERMLARVPDTFDKREGSVIYDAIAPSAYECFLLYQDIEQKEKNTFAGTADRDGLIKRGAEIGIAPFEATYALRKGLFTPTTLELNIGERFSYENLNFVIMEKLEDGVYSLKCETVGSVGNLGSGTLIPIDYIAGLETATLSGEVLIYAEDEEETEAFRKRYFATLPTMTLDGNIAQYTKWMSEYEGVGNFKIFPLWNGKNTVKVSILSAENTVASQTLLDEVQEYLDPEGEGLGNGKAPIGAKVTVTTAREVNIDIHATVVLRVGFDAPVGLEESIREYLKTLNYYRNGVSYIALGAIFANNESIELVVDVTLNGQKTDVALADETIAKLNSLTIEVV